MQLQLSFEVASYDALSFSAGPCLIPGNPTWRIQECSGMVSSCRPIRGDHICCPATMLPNERSGLIATTLGETHNIQHSSGECQGINWKGHGAEAWL